MLFTSYKARSLDASVSSSNRRGLPRGRSNDIAKGFVTAFDLRYLELSNSRTINNLIGDIITVQVLLNIDIGVFAELGRQCLGMLSKPPGQIGGHKAYSLNPA